MAYYIYDTIDITKIFDIYRAKYLLECKWNPKNNHKTLYTLWYITFKISQVVHHGILGKLQTASISTIHLWFYFAIVSIYLSI